MCINFFALMYTLCVSVHRALVLRMQGTSRKKDIEIHAHSLKKK